MLVKNLLHHAVLNGFTARFAMASDMLHELASQDSDASLARRLRRFTQPQLLAIDLCEAPSYVEFVPPIGDRRATLTIGTQHN